MKSNLLRKIIRVVEQKGFRGLFQTTFNWLKNKAKPGKKGDNSQFDQKYKVDTSGRISTADMNLNHDHWKYGHAYQPTEEVVFDEIISQLKINFSEYCFLDVGSGKGAALLYSYKYSFKKIIGVEFSPDLCQTASLNIQQCYPDDDHLFEIVCSDVLEYSLPKENFVIYLYNPFQKNIFEAFVEKIIRDFTETEKNIYLCYYTPLYEDVLLKWKDKFNFISRNEEYLILKLKIS